MFDVPAPGPVAIARGHESSCLSSGARQEMKVSGRPQPLACFLGWGRGDMWWMRNVVWTRDRDNVIGYFL